MHRSETNVSQRAIDLCLQTESHFDLSFAIFKMSEVINLQNL